MVWCGTLKEALVSVIFDAVSGQERSFIPTKHSFEFEELVKADDW
jgi:hypothetical protein